MPGFVYLFIFKLLFALLYPLLMNNLINHYLHLFKALDLALPAINWSKAHSFLFRRQNSIRLVCIVSIGSIFWLFKMFHSGAFS